MFLLALAGLVLGLLSFGPAADAATAARTPTTTTRTQARIAAKTAAVPAAKAARTAKTHAQCSTPKKGHMACDSLRRTDVTQPAALRDAAVVPNATPSGYGPSSLDSAYKLSTTGGSGQTVAIVDAYNDPTAASDLATYRTQFGLPACTVANGCFQQLNQNGATSPLPTNDTGWAGEESLDLDMVSAVCPNCHIILVEANSASNADLYAAEDRGATLAKFVSNSWGGSEYSGQTTDDSHFNHPGVAITVSSGDDATGAEFPATSQYVTAVGGTSLTSASNSRGWNETAWADAGSGCSAYDAKPSWQTVTTNCARRAEADVSAVADPNTGVAVYQTYGASGWQVYGGTSVSAPIIAGVYALAGTPAAGTYPASYPYSHTANLFDVTSGSNGSCGAPICTAGTGWDGPTGLGTPNGTTAFTNAATAPHTITVTNPGSRTATVGTPFSLQIVATDSTSGQALTYSATGLPTGLSIGSTTGLISGTPTASGTFSVTVTVKDPTGASGTTSFTTTVSTTGSGCTPAQLFGNPGFETGSAAPWTSTAGVVNANGAGETAHAGTHYAWLDGYGTTHTDTLSQSVSIPAACTHTTLSYYLHIDTAETTTTVQYDKLTVAASLSGGATTTLQTWSNLNHNTGYALESVSLAAYAGKTVKITFTGTEDSSLQTSFVIDDAAASTS